MSNRKLINPVDTSELVPMERHDILSLDGAWPKPFRPYQRRTCIEAAQVYHEGVREVNLVSPTGSGKTAMMAGIGTVLPLAGKTLIVAPTRDLVSQNEIEVTEWCRNFNIDHKMFDHSTWQQFISLLFGKPYSIGVAVEATEKTPRLFELKVDWTPDLLPADIRCFYKQVMECDKLFFDEVHKGASSDAFTFRAIKTAFGHIKWYMGVTATPQYVNDGLIPARNIIQTTMAELYALPPDECPLVPVTAVRINTATEITAFDTNGRIDSFNGDPHSQTLAVEKKRRVARGYARQIRSGCSEPLR
jgi:Type III restriction enzyme, res subunit